MAHVKKHSYSGVLINYNHAAFLPAAIKGALSQSLPFDELIIIDDASTDNSVTIIEELIRDAPQARLIRHEKNRGVVATLNAALTKAKGDFICYMAADDTYNPDMILWCEKLLAQHPQVSMISGNTRLVDSVTGEEQVFTLPFPQQISAYTSEDLKNIARTRAFTFFGGSNIFRRTALQEVGGQREELKWHSDWFLYLHMACRYAFGIVPIEVSRVRKTAGEYSRASRDWSQQRPVIETLLRLMRKDYPQEYAFFRDCALLPTYDPPLLPVLMGDEQLRDFLTPLLAWRLLSYAPLKIAGQILPAELRNSLRRALRV